MTILPMDVTTLLSPKSIAVIGASRNPEKVGAILLKNIIDSKFPGQIYPVNPQADKIGDLTCYPDINSLPEAVDLAVVVLPAAAVSDSLNQIAAKGIKNVIVISAGFKETGPEGEKLEKELLEISAKHSLNILGPNCLGFVNNTVPLNATFGASENLPGNLRFISQSGAIAASLFDWCQSVGLGFSHIVTLGNKTVLNENDFLSYFSDNLQNPTDSQTGLSPVSPIGLYLESISHGPEFLQLTSQISKTNPIFIIKPGKTPAAAAAMQSHTGAIAGADDILDTALDQAGVIRCQTLEDFFDLARAFAWEAAPAGNRIAIISNAGGPAVISADAVIAAGLELSRFTPEVKDRLSQVLPRSASIINPIDVLGDALAERYAAAAEIILASDQADTLLFILTPQMMTQVAKTAETIGALSVKYGKPIFCSFIGGRQVSEGEQILNKKLIPSFRFPEQAISAVGRMWHWQQLRTRPDPDRSADTPPPPENLDRIKSIVSQAAAKNHPTLDSLEADEISSHVGLPTPPSAAVLSLDEARGFAAHHGWPVVLKLSSPYLLHKAGVGGLVTNIWDDHQLEIAWNRLTHKLAELPDKTRDNLRFHIQKEVTSGIEVIVGIRHDPTFGPVLLFGAGGQLAELVSDTNLKILPVSRGQVIDLVARSKVAKLLESRPGEPPYAMEPLYDLIVRLTQMVPLIPEATDIEINPVIITHNAVWAIDSKILLASKAAHPVTPPRFHTAVVTKKEVLAAKFHYFEFESEDPLTYQPGQYISIKVAPNRINSYSVAGSLNEHKFLLLVDTSPGGPGSKFFENLQSGDKIAYMGPFGVFTFKPDDGAKRLLFLGTGTGCSPLRSILEGALRHHRTSTTPISFYFGLRHATDVFWQDYFQKLQEEHPNFNFTLSLSKPDESWQGSTGHITELVKQIPDAADCSAYLCGNQAMIDEATQLLMEKGCPKERIYSEKF